MSGFLNPENEFLQKIIGIIEENLGDENFGVPDLADEANMSRSNLLRKVKRLSGFSVSVFIRKVRLHHAREMLQDESLTASEVAFNVGFKSPSYFTKCFREEFGYTPGERKLKAEDEYHHNELSGSWFRPAYLIVLVIAVLAAVWLFQTFGKQERPELSGEKSIAVLPFTNDSGDSSNVYFINGVMQTILNNLQQIEDLKVTSRTTIEKYRHSEKSIPELSRELNVNYFVDGSGQKIDNKIRLSVQVIDARTDSPVWSKQYSEELEDIFKLQSDVAQNIAIAVKAIVTPVEQRNIEKEPTQNLVAYDLYLKGLNALNLQTREGLFEAIDHFNAAIKEDPKFAQAYAYVAVAYYYLDIFQADKQYSEEMNTYADKANLYDPELPESLIAKGLYFMHEGQYELAVEYFEKTLSYSPNSSWVHNMLSDIYNSYIPDTERYLTHALHGIQSAASSQDSTNASITYLHLSNALAQAGFLKESEKYISQSIAYDPDNIYSAYFRVYLDLALDYNSPKSSLDLPRAKNQLISILQMDTLRVDVLQEIAKICYTMEDYEEAWDYYSRYLNIKNMYKMDVFPSEDIK
ncbi:MAG: helix-turn-helix domain-containing protein, partial [Cyclobacteriaceae bacterium]